MNTKQLKEYLQGGYKVIAFYCDNEFDHSSLQITKKIDTKFYNETTVNPKIADLLHSKVQYHFDGDDQIVLTIPLSTLKYFIRKFKIKIHVSLFLDNICQDIGYIIDNCEPKKTTDNIIKALKSLLTIV